MPRILIVRVDDGGHAETFLAVISISPSRSADIGFDAGTASPVCMTSDTRNKQALAEAAAWDETSRSLRP